MNNIEDARIAFLGSGVHDRGNKMKGPLLHAKKLGVHCIVLDCAGSPLHACADEFYAIDPLDHDHCFRCLSAIQKSTSLQGVTSFLEEQSLMIAKLSHDLGLPGHSIIGANAARDKHEMRKLFSRLGLPTPKYYPIQSIGDISSLPSDFPFPAFLKVSDGGGSVGTRKINSHSKLLNAFEEVSHEIEMSVPSGIRTSILANYGSGSTNFLLEEYLVPAEHLAVNSLGYVTVEILTQNGNIEFFGIGDCQCVSETDHRFGTITFPSKLSDADQEKFYELARLIVDKLDFKNGPIILDGVLTKDGPQIFEINARIDNAVVVPIIEACWGIDLVEQILRIAIGLPIKKDGGRAVCKYATTTSIFADTLSIVERLDLAFVQDPSSANVFADKEVGERVSGPEGAYDSVATFNVFGSVYDEVVQERDRLVKDTVVDLRPIAIS
jgi:biotin carboxylase